MELNRSNYEDTRVELQDNTEEKIRKSVDKLKGELSDSINTEFSDFKSWADIQFINTDDKLDELSGSIYTELEDFKSRADIQFINIDTKLVVLLFLFFINIFLSGFILIRLGLE